jgi:hypothetical protein
VADRPCPDLEGRDHIHPAEANLFLQDDQGEEIARRVNEFVAATAQD